MLPVFEEGGFSSGSSRGRTTDLCGDAQERAAPDGRATYAIGDVHGCLSLLVEAFRLIHADAGERAADVVCLGDYVDRGPDSRGVVELLMRGPQREGDTLTCLKGNHEDMMVDAVTGASDGGLWLGNGGAQTLASYGERGVPASHIEWMRSLPAALSVTGRIFVHAGLFPGIPLAEQDEDAVLWIRDRFLLAEKDFAGWPHIVHGHTPHHPWKRDPAKPELCGWRTNLDTAAFHTGVLTIAAFEGDATPPARILTARAA